MTSHPHQQSIVLRGLSRAAHLSTRSWCTIIVCIAVISLLFAVIVLQEILGLEPCPLCVLDRILLIAIAVVALLGIVHNPVNRWRFFYGTAIFILSAIGTGICLWHIRLQNLPPDQVPSCGPGFDYIMDTFPLQKAMAIIFEGSGECAESAWTLFGFTIPEQTLGLFAVLTVLSTGIMLNKKR